ncbi:pro-pol polyprotein [Lasius niger]|uniref:RNA-directed DNA polymerase n=1 Tax=Lasius niger TaxID=67767 RepID=A0A0J7JXK7_LASNI|nr:pro-pol polyprotein [Lasius niger]
MAHVDALSRCVTHVDELPLERRLEFLQLRDPKILEISKELELNESDRFALVDGLVYRKTDGQLKFMIPESMVINILRAYHDDMAHCGSEKTKRGISQNYWFPTMRKRIQDHIDNCLTCVMSNSSPNRFEAKTHLFPLPKMPLDVLHVDHFGPLQETINNYKHVLVVVDALSRFTWLFATKSTGTKETVIQKILYLHLANQ